MIETILSTARQAAERGALVLQEHWGKLERVDFKSSHSDLVTIADKESEKIIIETIKNQFPSHAILAEESGLEAHTSDYMWIIDPLDGTTNYTHQYPVISVSIGVLYKKEPLVAIVYNPILKENFEAIRGKGATLNGKPIHVSQVKALPDSLLATGFAYDRLKTPETNYKEFTHFTQATQGVRRAGSAALDLAYVAAGRLDGYWERGIKPWDMAAGWLLVLEAGGKVSAYDGSPVDIHSGQILASNGHLHEVMSNHLAHLKKH